MTVVEGVRVAQGQVGERREWHAGLGYLRERSQYVEDSSEARAMGVEVGADPFLSDLRRPFAERADVADKGRLALRGEPVPQRRAGVPLSCPVCRAIGQRSVELHDDLSEFVCVAQAQCAEKSSDLERGVRGWELGGSEEVGECTAMVIVEAAEHDPCGCPAAFVESSSEFLDDGCEGRSVEPLACRIDVIHEATGSMVRWWPSHVKRVDVTGSLPTGGWR